MSLQSAFRSAQSALAANAFQTTTVSRNVAGANVAGYARKLAIVDTTIPGIVSASRVDRAADFGLQGAVFAANAKAQGADAISRALDSLQTIVGDPASGASPSSGISDLKSALLQAAAAPQDNAGLAAAVSAAQSLAATLTGASKTVQGVRQQADQDMAASVASINSLLKSFDTANATIIAGQATGQDVSDARDQRDAVLLDLSKLISISTIQEPNGGMSIYADSGVALFQGAPRSVSMQQTQTFAPGVDGGAVYIDGVAVTGPSAAMPLKSGALAGFAEIRDKTANIYQSQLDEIATGLISAFSQSSATPSSGQRTGLFTWSGAPSVPLPGARGVAAEIRVDPSAVKDPTLLRDGGIGNDPAFVANPTGSASYAGTLYALVDALGAPQSFNAAELPARASVTDLSSQSEAWLETARQSATDQSTNANAMLVQATTALSNAVGVNIDDQMSRMLDLENSYQASAKMMATIDTMYAALFSAIPAT